MFYRRDPPDPPGLPPSAADGGSKFGLGAPKWAFGLSVFFALVFTASSVMPVSSFAPPGLARKGARATSNHYAPEPVSVTVVEARRETFVSTLVVSGSLVAREEVVVGSELEAAAIEEILVDEGDKVTQGQVLARLRSDLAQAALVMNDAQIERADAMIAQADSAIREAEVTLRLANNINERARSLLKSGAESMDVLEQRQAGAETARARLQSAHHARDLALAERSLAQAQRQDLTIRLDRSEVKAPAAGLVVQRLAQRGMLVSGDSGPLFRLIKDGTIELDALVPMSDLARLEQDLQADVVVAGATVPIAGKVRLVASRVDVASRMGNVRISIESDEKARIGVFAQARIHLHRPGSMVLPLTALLSGTEGIYVQVVKGGIVESRPVTVSDYAADAVRIETGVVEGEHVILTAGAWVRSGEQVAATMAAQVVALKD
ncbi:efflux RND transporter periplasmic adaptor subunit [Rhizobium herbae]